MSRILLPVATAVLLIVWAFNLPRPSKLAYLKVAGHWIRQEVPINARVLTNDLRIAYFSGRPYGETMPLWTLGFHLTQSELNRFDYFVIKAKDESSLPTAIRHTPGKRLVRALPGEDGDNVFVYARKSDATAAGDNGK